jgi:hypothetical protein
VSVLLGDGAGGFGIGASYSVGSDPISITAGDLNNDGFLDLATANLTANSVSQLAGNGDGTFTAASTTFLSGQPGAVIAADFDFDGRCDLLVSEINVGVGLALGTGTGFPDDFVFSTVGTSGRVVAADFRLGHGLDLGVVSGGQGGAIGSVTVLLDDLR